MQKNVTIQNVTTLTLEEIYGAMSEMYDNVMVPEDILTIEDLEKISAMLGWAVNQKAYLNSLHTWLDIRCRQLKELKEKEAYTTMVGRKAVVKAYFDRVDDIYKACSRQGTLWSDARKERAEIDRLENMFMEASKNAKAV